MSDLTRVLEWLERRQGKKKQATQVCTGDTELDSRGAKAGRAFCTGGTSGEVLGRQGRPSVRSGAWSLAVTHVAGLYPPTEIGGGGTVSG